MHTVAWVDTAQTLQGWGTRVEDSSVTRPVVQLVNETPGKTPDPEAWWIFPTVELGGLLEGDTPRFHGERAQKTLPDLGNKTLTSRTTLASSKLVNLMGVVKSHQVCGPLVGIVGGLGGGGGPKAWLVPEGGAVLSGFVPLNLGSLC